MADEEKTPTEELTDEQANDVSGGFIVPKSSLARPCATPGCKGKVPIGSSSFYCDKCLRNRAGN